MSLSSFRAAEGSAFVLVLVNSSLALEAMSARDEWRDRILHLQSVELQDEAKYLGIRVPDLH
jgi:hypothetical protein